MEKKKFYITVATGEVLENKEDLNYEFEIVASDEEVDQLQELFEETDNSAQNTFSSTFLSLNANDNSKLNQDYDYYLTEVYRMLHKLGTEETKRHIESMHILENGI